MYQQDFNRMLPCHWPGLASSGSTSNPWRTYEAGRVVPGTVGWSSIGTDVQGPWNLGLLVATGMIPNPRILYCPGTALLGGQFSYNYYAAVSNTWPSTALPTGDQEIRTGYNYLPQGKKQVHIDASHIGPILVNYTCPLCTPLQLSDLDPAKSLVTDMVRNIDSLSHRASGSVAGLNALFPDGRVVFQSARSNPQAFDPNLWLTSSDSNYIGNNPVNFRIVMSFWHP
jgi:hypothetical protein